MNLSTYNILWGIIKLFLPSYLERRQKKGKEDKYRLNERYGTSKKMRPNGTIVWLHGTSVGESVAALALANSMKKNGVFLLTVQGKGGIVTNITYDVLAKGYHNDRETKLFFDKIFKKPSLLKKYVGFLKKNSDNQGKIFLELFLKMANADFMQTLEDRIKSKRYYQYTFKEIQTKLKKVGFRKISKIKKLSKFKYRNLRQIFNSLYIHKNNNLSKIFFGKDSSHINLRIIK